MANAIDILKKICPYAAIQTLGSRICEKSGLKKASKPCDAPGNVTARRTIIKNIIVNVGIKMRLATSIPFRTPLYKIPKTTIHTMINGKSTPGTKFPICPAFSTTCKCCLNKNDSASAPQLNCKENPAYDNAQAIINETYLEITNATSTPHPPTHSVRLFIRRNDKGEEPGYLWPIVNSIIKMGIPAVNKANKYGTKNAPPPFA